MRIIIITSRATRQHIVYVQLTDNFGSWAGGARIDKNGNAMCRRLAQIATPRGEAGPE